MSDPVSSQVVQFVEWNVVEESVPRLRAILADAIGQEAKMACPDGWDRAVWSRLARENGTAVLARTVRQDCVNELSKRGEFV